MEISLKTLFVASIFISAESRLFILNSLRMTDLSSLSASSCLGYAFKMFYIRFHLLREILFSIQDVLKITVCTFAAKRSMVN